MRKEHFAKKKKKKLVATSYASLKFPKKRNKII